MAHDIAGERDAHSPDPDPGRLPPSGAFSDRHSPGLPGTRLLSEGQVLDHLVGLVGAEAGGPESLWFTFLSDDDRILPVAVPCEDLPSFPDPATVRALSALVAEVVDESFPGATVLVAVVRASGGDYGAHERRWAGALWRAAEADGWVVRAVAAVGVERARLLSRERCL